MIAYKDSRLGNVLEGAIEMDADYEDKENLGMNDGLYALRVLKTLCGDREPAAWLLRQLEFEVLKIEEPPDF